MDMNCYFGCPKCEILVPQVIAQKLSRISSEVIELYFLQDVNMDGNFSLMNGIAVGNDEKDFTVFYICGRCGSPVQRIRDNTHNNIIIKEKHEQIK